MSPLLFVIYINDLLMQFEDTTLVSAYADDLAIACSGRSKIDMTKKLQKEVDKVVKWSDDARLTLNTNKCEVSFFSLCTAEASWQPHITIRGLPLSFNAAPTFLGVQYDRQLTFSEHAKKVCQAMTKRTNILRALGGTTWGWRPAELRTIYIAIQRSLAEYGSQAWAPWLSKSNLGKLESAQLNAARAITGHLRSTPGEFVLKEAHLTPLEARYKTLSLLKADSWLQQADTDPRRLTLDRQAPQRLVKTDWRGLTTPVLRELNLFSQHQTGEARLPPPWDRPPPAPIYMTPASKSMPQIVQLEKAQRTIEEVGHSDLQIYTDGSTTDGTRNGGAGMIIARDKKVLHRWHAPTGVRSSSYSAEKAALEAALKWLESENDWHRAVIVCDCKSLVEATGNPHQTDPIIVTYQRSIARITRSKELLIVWAPGHCNLWGNELADSEAKRGSTLPQPAERNLDSKTRKAVIHREDRPLSSSHHRFLDLYTTNTNLIKENTLNKAELTDLVRFRSGHHPSLRRWLHLTGKADSDLCRLCEEEVESAEHLWLNCPAFARARFCHNIGTSYDELVRLPQPALAHLRTILRRLR